MRALVLMVAWLLVVAPVTAEAGPVVSTQSGDIEGVIDGTAAEWRGVPYAAPPVGSARWRAPAAPVPWAGVRDATSFVPQCPQLELDPEGVERVGGSEDCLYLNVFAPPGTQPGAKLPVMVHLHGGGNGSGVAYRDAAAFVERGVIVVTVGYRLGVFGFAGHPALSAEGGGSSGEYGLLDQVEALRWVNQNIAAFGGNPDNVMLFGLSAGSFDTVALISSPLAHGLITRAAVQGEPYWPLTGEFSTIADGEQLGLDIAARAGCVDVPDPAACMRGLSAEQLVFAAGPLDVGPRVGGVVLPAAPIEALPDNPLPLLVGFNREEEIGSLPFVSRELTHREWTQETYVIAGPRNAHQVRSMYPLSEYESYKWAVVAMLTDAIRGCPTRRLALANAGAPTYRFLWTHVYENDPFVATFRASHALEEPFLWNDFDIFFPYEPTAAEETLSGQMADYWVNFAKSGDPNGPGLAPWPRYEPATELTLTLDTPIGVASKYHSDECAFWDALGTPGPFFPRGRAVGFVPPY